MTTKEASQDQIVIDVGGKFLDKLLKVNGHLVSQLLEEQLDKTVATLSKALDKGRDRFYSYVDVKIASQEISKALEWVGAEKLTENWAEKGHEEKEPVPEMHAVEVYPHTKYIALVAHNEMKSALKGFVAERKDFFSKVPLVTTGSTGKTLNESLGIPVAKLVASGPLGGDQAIGGMISEKKIAAIFFFKDPLSSHAHAADIEALTRLCDVHQVPYATNPASAIGILMVLQEFGTDWQLDADQHSIVDKYKKAQAKVIQSVSKQ